MPTMVIGKVMSASARQTDNQASSPIMTAGAMEKRSVAKESLSRW